jgi:antitoxin HicB
MKDGRFRGDLAARFAPTLAYKDSPLAGDLATQHGVPSRLLDLCQMKLLEAMNRGWGDEDRIRASTLQEERAGEAEDVGSGSGPQTHEGDRAMRKQTIKKASIGSAFDDFLKNEGTYEATQAVAIKRVLAWQIEKAMREQCLTKAEMARRMETNRSQLDRLLDPDSDSVTLETLTRAARAIGRQVKLELV